MPSSQYSVITIISIKMPEKKQRLLSLDILRGITVAGMILVNSGHGDSFEMLRHSKWNGMTPCDLVFPFFLFILVISLSIGFATPSTEKSVPIWNALSLPLFPSMFAHIRRA